MNQQQRAVVQQVRKYLVPGTIVPVDVPTTQLLLRVLRQLLEQPAPVQEPADEPHALYWAALELAREQAVRIDELEALLAKAQPAAWVGLTADEMLEALVSVDPATKRLPIGFARFAQAIEAKLKEKNGGAA